MTLSRSFVAGGVTGYERRTLDKDHRWSVLMHIATPVSQAAIDIPPVIWQTNLERVPLAVDDLECRDLLARYGLVVDLPALRSRCDSAG